MKALRQLLDNSYELRTQLPEDNLLMSVLADGLGEASGHGTCIGRNSAQTRRRRQRQALHWINHEAVYCSPQEGISFRFICERLGLDDKMVRLTVMTRGDVIRRFMHQYRDRSEKASRVKAAGRLRS